MPTRLALLGPVVLAIASCSVTIPEGRLRCETAAECPPGWSCSAGVCINQRIRVTAVAGGTTHTCAITSDDRVWCWGSNEQGELGIGSASTVDVTIATEVEMLRGASVDEVRLGNGISCALAVGEQLWCWGSNQSLALGDERIPSFADTPVEVALPAAPVEVAVGSNFVCARLEDARVVCWGQNISGQLGRGETSAPDATPAEILWDGAAPTAITAGAAHACARFDDGSVACWGVNTYGVLGVVSEGASSTPLVVSTLPAVIDVEAMGEHNCARLADGSVWCWGNNAWHQLGREPTTDQTPGAVPGLMGVEQLAGGGAILTTLGHSCAIGSAIGVQCWGDGNAGQTGQGNTDPLATPTPVEMLSHAEVIASGSAYTCAISDGELYCWGNNNDGQLGIASMARALVPTQVMGLTQ